MNGAQSGVSLEVVAAITAALSVVLDKPAGAFRVTSVVPEQPAPAPAPSPSMWAKAGVFESHLARRGFGVRSR